jgi:hypothetical protein
MHVLVLMYAILVVLWTIVGCARWWQKHVTRPARIRLTPGVPLYPEEDAV